MRGCAPDGKKVGGAEEVGSYAFDDGRDMKARWIGLLAVVVALCVLASMATRPAGEHVLAAAVMAAMRGHPLVDAPDESFCLACRREGSPREAEPRLKRGGNPSGSDMPLGMNQPAKLFRPSSVGAGASLFTVVSLMLGNPFLVLTFFVCTVYAVVPWSLWHK